MSSSPRKSARRTSLDNSYKPLGQGQLQAIAKVAKCRTSPAICRLLADIKHYRASLRDMSSQGLGIEFMVIPQGITDPAQIHAIYKAFLVGLDKSIKDKANQALGI